MKSFPNWIKITALTIFLVLSFVLCVHLLLNSSTFQHWALNKANQSLPVDLKWEDLTFNGATGHFDGSQLSLHFPKTRTTITLKKFSLAFSPIRFLFKKIHLLDLRANDLYVTLEEPPPKKEGAKKSPEKLTKLLDLLEIDKATISNIHISGPNNLLLNIQKLNLTSQKPFLIYQKAIDTTLHNIQFLSKKADLFIDELTASGSFDITYSESTQKIVPHLDGNIGIHGFLFGLNKKPVPWNLSPGWDQSLTHLLEKAYPDGIPENRAYGYVEEIDLPLFMSSDLFQIEEGLIHAFDGILQLDGRWDKRHGPIRAKLTTQQPMKMALLPMGKANFRRSFEKFSINLQSQGQFHHLKKGSIASELKVSLQNNLHVPEFPEIILSSQSKFRDGVIDLQNLDIKLGKGSLQAKGTIDLNTKKIQSTLEASDINAETIIHFFSDIDFPGYANVKGSIGGSLTNPLFDLTLSSPGFGYEGLHFGTFQGNLKISDHHLTLQGQSRLKDQGQGQIDLNIDRIFRSSLQKVSLKTQFKNLPAGPLIQSAVVSGQVAGHFNMTKYQGDFDGEGKIEAFKVRWYGLPIDQIRATLRLDDRKLIVRPLVFNWGSNIPTTSVNRPFIFSFTPQETRFEGWILPTMQAKGVMTKKNPDRMKLSLMAQSTRLPFLAPLFPFKIEDITAAGSFEIDYFFGTPKKSIVKGQLTKFTAQGTEKNLRLIRPTRLSYENGKYQFQNTALQLGKGSMTINGPLSLNEGSNLKMKGSLDLEQMNEMLPWFLEGEGLAKLDLTWQGSINEPIYQGKILFNHNSLLLSGIERELNDISGALILSGKRLRFENFHTQYDDAPITLKGWIDWVPTKQILAADLSLKGKEIPLSHPDTWHLLTDADVRLRGSGSSIRLSGLLKVVEGLYFKDYSLSQFVLKPIGVSYRDDRKEIPEILRPLHLDLEIKSAGEFEIKNNLAELILNGDIGLQGTMVNPLVTGTINIVEGNIHALGIDFENATGFASYTRSKPSNPHIDFRATQDIQEFEVRAHITGPAENLSVAFESTPALNQNDIISLIAYGLTPDQLSSDRRDLFNRAAVASQVVSLIERPISKATHLDIVRLEAEPDRSTGPVATRFSIGKQLSTRFSLAFTTDLDLEQAFQGVTAEYRLIDGILLKGTKDAGSRYRFDLTWRFQVY